MDGQTGIDANQLLSLVEEGLANNPDAQKIGYGLELSFRVGQAQAAGLITESAANHLRSEVLYHLILDIPAQNSSIH